MKRIISFTAAAAVAVNLLGVCMTSENTGWICSLPAYAEAADSGFFGESLTWTLDSSGTLTISGEGAMQDCPNRSSPFFDNQIIQKVIISEGVTSIGTGAFSFCTGLKSVRIADSVTSIGEFAFEFCEELTDITIPDGVICIGAGAFEGCSSLTGITLPTGITSINDSTFSRCAALTSIAIPAGVISIGDSAFRFCTGLTDITIPKSVERIGGDAFSDCENLTIRGWTVSFAEIYARKHSIPFEAVAKDLSLGDITLDGDVGLRDAVLLAKAIDGIYTLPVEARKKADMNYDGAVNQEDLKLLLRRLAGLDW